MVQLTQTYELHYSVELFLIHLRALLALLAPWVANLPAGGLLLGQGHELVINTGLNKSSGTWKLEQ